jgi:hypothetical protein
MLLSRSFAGEGKRRAGCNLFCNQRDAQVRVPRSHGANYFRNRAEREGQPAGVYQCDCAPGDETGAGVLPISGGTTFTEAMSSLES